MSNRKSQREMEDGSQVSHLKNQVMDGGDVTEMVKTGARRQKWGVLFQTYIKHAADVQWAAEARRGIYLGTGSHSRFIKPWIWLG